MPKNPEGLKYTKDHEWARAEDDLVRVGITQHAVEQLGDVTLVDLPAVGTNLSSGKHFGDIESVKAVSELFAPLTGQVVAVNDALKSKPELINEAPYADGWMIVLRPSSKTEIAELMDAAAYDAFLGTL
jgi:glycine cleavage system H protein